MALDPHRVKALFNSALDLPDPEQKPAFLDRECGEDPELRRRLEDLLAAHDAPASVLDRPLAADPGEVPIDPEQTQAALPEGAATGSMLGAVIAGRYKIREEIGEGGMGSVYLADQTSPVKRRVALKLIKAGMDTRAVLARFESERQALALMDHPNIAKVFDAGSTEGGRPFFVMELVKGVPLNDYCDQHRLDLPERLALFRQICSAVQHAHQKGIIHRDLKPTNILVESHDGRPVPKVIDFGLAKATSGQPIADESLYTAFGAVTGTPLYMAPEQASFNALDVDTRADIYALGVILYELLTGSTPIQRDKLQRAGLEEMLRVIREVEPPTPSSRISTSEGLPSLAAARHIEPSRLSRFLRGDLDWIVMKALAKERHRRYDSAIGLANDIERFTNHEPVSAGPPTAAYRFRKFVRRNRPQAIATALVLLALVGGIVGTMMSLVEARRQEREARRQERIAFAAAGEKEKARQAEALQRRQAEKRLAQIEKTNEILGSVFKNLDPRKADLDGRPLRAVLGERLDQATTQIEEEAIGDPLAVARMQETLGQSQIGLGSPDKAIGLLAKAYAAFTAQLGPDHPDTLASMNSLATAYAAAGKLDLAIPLHEQTLALMKAQLGPDHEDTLRSMDSLGASYRDVGRLDEALPLLEKTLALMKVKLEPSHAATLICMSNLASGYQDAGKLDLAVPLFEQTLTLLKAKLGSDHPVTLSGMNNLAAAYGTAGKRNLAMPLYEQTLALMKAQLGPDHPNTLVCMNNLALSYKLAGDLDRALPLYERTLSGQKTKLGPDHPDTITSMNNLAAAYLAAGKLDQALPLLRELADLHRRRSGSDSPRYSEALASLGLNFLRQEKWTDAEPILREAVSIREAKAPDVWTTYNAKSLLGGSLLGQKKYADAEPLLRAGYEGMKQRADTIPPQWKKIRLGEALDRLIEVAAATDKPDDAKAWEDEKAKWADAPTPEPQPVKQ